MNPVELRVVRHLEGPGGRVYFVERPSRAGERLALLEGVVPAACPEHPSIAPIALAGSVDGRPAYAETLPEGIALSEAQPPADLLPYVVHEVHAALGHLHAAGLVHGNPAPDRVLLGRDGGVVLFGRGRGEGSAERDRAVALSMLASGQDTTLEGSSTADLARLVPPDARERLAAWIGAHRAPPPSPGSGLAPEEATRIVLLPGGADEAVDEVVPEIGPDRDGKGLLDRWATTSSSGASRPEEVTAASSSPLVALAGAVWNRLSAPPRHPPPDDRFAGRGGISSNAIRDLLAGEPPDVLPVPSVGRRESFAGLAQTQDEVPTVALSGPEALGPAWGPRAGREVWIPFGLAAALGAFAAAVVYLFAGQS